MARGKGAVTRKGQRLSKGLKTGRHLVECCKKHPLFVSVILYGTYTYLQNI